MKKSELNPNIHLSEGNLKSTSDDRIAFLVWSLPSRVTCHYATPMCRQKCYAKKNETFGSVKLSRNRNLEESKKESFVQDMIDHITYHLQRPKYKDKRIIVRLNSSGDIYDMAYFKKWVAIAQHFKGNEQVYFGGTTKAMPVVRDYIQSIKGNDIIVAEDIKILKDTNIDLIWSIFEDTPYEYTQTAQTLGMQTFTAMSKADLEHAEERGYYVCKGNGGCSSCLTCFSGSSIPVAVPYH